MRKIRYRIEEETWEEQRAAGRHNPGLVLITGRKNHRTPFECSRNDDVDVRKSGDHLYILTRDNRFGYVGLDVLKLQSDGEPTYQAAIFLQSTEQVDELLGKDGIDRSVPYIIRTLAQYV